MNYIEKKALYYTLLCSEILDQPFDQVFRKISSVFTCTDCERKKIYKYLNNQEFLKLRSIQAIVMRINFVRSFCDEKHLFGLNVEEEESLLVKKAAYAFIIELSKDPMTTTDLRTAVANIAEQDNKFALLYALILYCQNETSEKIDTILKKAVREGVIDAMLALPFFVRDEQRAGIIADIKRNNSSRLYNELIERINNAYLKNKGDENNAE